jgi:hypothetical protein
MTTFESSRTSTSLDEKEQSPLASGRVYLGIFYGLLIGVIYATVAQTIDVILMTDVPLAVDQSQAIIFIVTTAISGALLGVIVAWPKEAWKGALFGAIAITAWGLLQSALALSVTSLILLPLGLPLIVMSLPISGVMRLAVYMHENFMQETGFKRARNMSLLFAGAVFIAVLSGSWAQMPPYAQEAVRQVDRVLEFARDNPDRGLSVALRDASNVLDHLDQPYTLHQTAVDSSPTGVEVSVNFADGFVMSCLVGQQGDIPYCQEGRNVFSDPGG